MRYFTKKYYVTELLSFTDKAVRKSKQAEIKDEEFYKYLYNKQ